jgi:mono/diheme cytochrome c family protein
MTFSRPFWNGQYSFSLTITTGLIWSVAATFVAIAADVAPFDLKDPKTIEDGRVLFAQTCVYCHGDSGSGGKAGPLKGRTDLTSDYLHTTISNGKRAGALVMPAWKDSLDDATIWKLVAFIGSLQAAPAENSK